MSDSRLKGKVKFFNAGKGFGFITATDGNEYYIHFSNIECDGDRKLAVTEEVEFSVRLNERRGKWEAVEVTRLGPKHGAKTPCIVDSEGKGGGKKGVSYRKEDQGYCGGGSEIGAVDAEKSLAEITQTLVDKGVYSEYVSWRDEYQKWRFWGPQRPISDGAVLDIKASKEMAWRDDYRRWRTGHAQGARGETGTAVSRPLVALACPPSGTNLAGLDDEGTEDETSQHVPAVVFDVVVMGESNGPALVPVDGPPVPPILVKSFPPEASVTIRTFRFFESRADEKQVWEQELQNVNSGSLVFVPVHMCPGLHSSAGAKFGNWFTIHYIQVYVKHFSSSYFMADEGNCLPAKTFGATAAATSTISGSVLESGYFWYVSPAKKQATLQDEGWQHLYRAGPFDGIGFLDDWRKSGSPMEPRALQEVLNRATSNKL